MTQKQSKYFGFKDYDELAQWFGYPDEFPPENRLLVAIKQTSPYDSWVHTWIAFTDKNGIVWADLDFANSQDEGCFGPCEVDEPERMRPYSLIQDLTARTAFLTAIGGGVP